MIWRAGVGRGVGVFGDCGGGGSVGGCSALL